ncbi:hypothetical protein HDU98_006738 [Podochytrium sp. JEL0797]|nr:hypothetical protein HDU98_006738 [Podochytrium sp. JEL0797]
MGQPRSLPCKESHGDVDFIVACASSACVSGSSGCGSSGSSSSSRGSKAAADSPGSAPHAPTTPATRIDTPSLAAALGASAHVASSRALSSFAVDDHQVDVLRVCCSNDDPTTTAEKFHAALAFHDFGDLGRIVGYVAATRGLTYCDKGLVARIYSTDSHALHSHQDIKHRLVIGSIVLTPSIPNALQYLHFNAKKWVQGFENERDMHDFLIESAYLDPARVLAWLQSKPDSAKLRPGVLRFQDYLAQWVVSPDPSDETQSNPAFQLETRYKMEAVAAFDKMSLFSQIVREFEQKSALDQQIKDRFSGHVIMKVIGESEGKNVGKVKSRVRKLLEEKSVPVTEFAHIKLHTDGWKSTVLNMTEDEVEALIARVWDDVRNQP